MVKWSNSSPETDESYWQALLSEDIAKNAPEPNQAENDWSAFAPYLTSGQASSNGWQQAQELLETGALLQLQVKGYNRGGLLIEWHSLTGFVPASHLTGLTFHLTEEKRLAELANYVGSTLTLKIIELDASEKRFILSERATIDDEARKTVLLHEIQPEQIRRGCVTNLCDFGAFVDLGGVEGLIHISEISWGRINHPGDMLESGQNIDVHVINVDPENGRVGLSLKRLMPDPWEGVRERYQVGQLVQGTVTNVVNFGAFTRLEEGLEGLIHVSELAEGNFLHPRNVVNEGETVIARVLHIDGERRRIALSLRQTC